LSAPALPLGEIRLRDVHLSASDRLPVRAEFDALRQPHVKNAQIISLTVFAACAYGVKNRVTVAHSSLQRGHDPGFDSAKFRFACFAVICQRTKGN